MAAHIEEFVLPVSSLYFGVDAAKDELVINCYGGPEMLTLPNQHRAVTLWVKALPAGAMVAVEATGAYHLQLVQACQAAGVAVYVLNPRRVRKYAEGVGRRAKTDRIDARLIARYLAQEHAQLQPWQVVPPVLAEVRELLARREKVVQLGVALRQSLGQQRALSGQIKKTLRELNALARALLQRAKEQLAQEQPLLELGRLLRSIPGVGPVCSLALCFALKRVAWPNADAFIASLGLDPRACDSGKKRGRRKITKEGPALLRKLLYLSGMAARRNTLFAPIYEALIQRGLSTTEAFMILGRKLARIAWAIARSGKPFDSAQFSGTSCATT